MCFTLRVITSGHYVLESSLTLVETVKRYLTTSEQVDTATIVSIAKNISQVSLNTYNAVMLPNYVN